MSEINVRMTGFSRIDYDKKPIRKVLRAEVNLIRDAARALVSVASPSAPGEFPGKRTGVLRRAIKSKVLAGGLAAVARPEKTPRMGKDFYPAFLIYGVKQRGGKALNRGLVPRKDYMLEALHERSAAATNALRIALESSMVPR